MDVHFATVVVVMINFISLHMLKQISTQYNTISLISIPRLRDSHTYLIGLGPVCALEPEKDSREGKHGIKILVSYPPDLSQFHGMQS
jgi:hypothetical protein